MTEKNLEKEFQKLHEEFQQLKSKNKALANDIRLMKEDNKKILKQNEYLNKQNTMLLAAYKSIIDNLNNIKESIINNSARMQSLTHDVRAIQQKLSK